MFNIFKKKTKLPNSQELYDLALQEIKNKQISEGYTHLIQSANLGLPDAEYLYGTLILEGKINGENKLGVEMLKRAAEMNHPLAINNLAIIYQLGKHGVTRDLRYALELLKKASALGDRMADFNIAQALIFGIGCKKDINSGVKLLTSVANEGIDEAQHLLGQIYRDGLQYEKEKFLEPNKELAIKYFSMAAEKGNTDSIQALLGMGIQLHVTHEYCVETFMQCLLHYDIDFLKCFLAPRFTYSEFQKLEKDSSYQAYDNISKETFLEILNTEFEQIHIKQLGFQVRKALDETNNLCVETRLNNVVSRYLLETSPTGINHITKYYNI